MQLLFLELAFAYKVLGMNILVFAGFLRAKFRQTPELCALSTSFSHWPHCLQILLPRDILPINHTINTTNSTIYAVTSFSKRPY